MKLKNNSLIAGGFAHPKNTQSVNLRLASNLLKTFQTPYLAVAQKVISNNQPANMQSAQILSVTGSYSQKKDGVTTVLIWTQQGIKKNGYEFNYIRLALNLPSLRGSVYRLPSLRGLATNYPNNIGLVQHSNLVKDVQPFGSMPRLSNSLRRRRLTHPDLLSSPSSFMAIAKRSDSSLSSRNCITWRSLLSFVDIVNSYALICNQVDNVLQCMTFCKATPRSARDTIEAFNHNVKESYTMAIYKSTQTHPKFIQHQSGKFFPHHSAKFLAQYKPVKNNLPLLVEFSYIDSAPYKTGVRFRSLNIPKATHDAESVFFCVQTKHINAPYSHSMVWCIPLKAVNLLSIGWNTLHRPSMVALVGQPSGWLVFPFGTSTANPVNVTTPNEFRSSGGDSLNKPKEIIPMMTIPNSAYPKFLWRFFSCQQSKYFTVEAISEQEARSMLPDAPCLFSARIRQGVNHA